MATGIRTFSLGLLIGLLLGVVIMQVAVAPLSEINVPSHGVSTATGCVDADDPRAWVGHVPNSDFQGVYLSNYSVVHDAADVRVRADLSDSGGAWRLAITTSPRGSSKQVSEGCQPRTLVDASAAIPTTADTLTITLDGEPVVTVATTGQSPTFRYLEE